MEFRFRLIVRLLVRFPAALRAPVGLSPLIFCGSLRRRFSASGAAAFTVTAILFLVALLNKNFELWRNC
jgi:hypothetical protein